MKYAEDNSNIILILGKKNLFKQKIFFAKCARFNCPNFYVKFLYDFENINFLLLFTFLKFKPFIL